MAKTAYERNKNAIKKYLAEKTDDIRIRVPKGKKDEYKAFAAERGTSLNALICELLDREMRNDKFESRPNLLIEGNDSEGI